MFGRQPERPGDLPHQFGEVDRGGFQADAIARETGDVEENIGPFDIALDDCLEQFQSVDDRSHITFAGCLQKQPDLKYQRRHRVAQFVRGDRQEAVAGD